MPLTIKPPSHSGKGNKHVLTSTYSRMKQFLIFLSLVSLVVCFCITAHNEAPLLTELTKALAIIACLNLIRILPKTS